MNNLVLVGFMGSGKSAVGKRVADILNLTFTDMDVIIEARAEKPISRIFEEDGEDIFRAMERDVVRELSSQAGRVVAAGGGVVLNPENIRDFSGSGLVVCLTASEEELFRRLSSSTNRPLLASGEMKEKISLLLNKRRPLYDAIPSRVMTDGLTVEEVAKKVVELFKNNFRVPKCL